MADPKVVSSANPPAAAPAEPREIPSFSKVVQETTDARSAELAELAGVKPGTKKTLAPDPAAPPADAFDFDGEWSKLPENFRTGIVERFNAGYNEQLAEKYSDILPLVIEANTNPQLREALALAAKDDKFRGLLSKPKFIKEFNKLTDDEQFDFLVGEASDTYTKYSTPATTRRAAADAPDPRDERIAALEDRFATESDGKVTQKYISDRQSEFIALRNAFPDLAKPEAAKQAEHVINTAEERFESAALRAGIATRNKDNSGRERWVAEALRAGIKPPSYREMHEMYAEVLGRSAPPVAPATSPSSMPAPAQAPRDASEGKNRALTLLKNSGGLKGLATASSRRK